MAAGFFRRFTKRFFVLCNLIVAVLFLLGCYASVLNPRHFWFTGLLTLGAPYLLLLLLLFILFWLVLNARYIFISIVAMLLAWVPLGQLFKLRSADEAMAAKKPADLRVMSWNIEHFDILEHKTHPEKKEEMLNLINKYEPDVACFQEMVGGDLDSTAINYVPAIARQLHYTEYHYSYDRSNDFDDKHHFGIITFSRYPIINKKTIGLDRHNYNFIFQYIDIVKDRDTFRVFNIHLQSLKFSNSNRKYIDNPSADEINVQESKSILSKLKRGFLKRAEQSENIKAEMNKSPYPVIVCGDFNDVPNSYAYKLIGKGMRNAFAEKGSGIGRTFSDVSPTLRIDNIFTDTKFDVLQYVRVKKLLSDHFPVIADLHYTPQVKYQDTKE